MDWMWIDITALPSLPPDRKLVLFGAGNGSRELLAHFAEAGVRSPVLAVLDNDPTMHGRHFEGIPVHAPADLPALGADLVVVTTISGRDAVAAQLESMGLSPDADYVCVGIYPRMGSLGSLQMLVETHFTRPILEGRVLHVGPGGFMGLECGLSALFGENISSLHSVDAYGFNSIYPRVTSELASYRLLRKETMLLAAKHGLDEDEVAARWDGLFRTEGSDPLLDTKRIDLRMPHRFSALPFPDGSFDLVCSFEVLEHVRHPDKAVAEIHRVLAPGGISYQKITTCDHRSFGAVAGYSPISYRTHSEAEWERINSDKFYQNRVAPFQWKELFTAHGFTIEDYRVGTRYEPPQDELARLHPDFRSWPLERQQEVNCVIVAAKP